MMLSGERIKQLIGGAIHITPFQLAHVNPNSVDLTLSPQLRMYKFHVLDMRQDNEYECLTIPLEGIVLNPHVVYIGSTIEYTETHAPYVPMLDGRSSVGRLGLSVHATAGFGDCGFRGTWTLEMFCVQPVRIYAGVKICQISYLEVTEPITPYAGKYLDQREPTTSRLHKDFNACNNSP